jgi:DNA-binding MarR family transcriptional regulator
MADGDLLAAAMAVRSGVTRLARRLRLERAGPREPLLHLAVLAHLRHGPMTPGQLAALEKVQPQSLTRTLASLESEQLITRQAHPKDGRRALLAITSEGLQTLRDDMGQRDAWLAETMAQHLTGTECELLRLAGDLLGRLAEADVVVDGDTAGDIDDVVDGIPSGRRPAARQRS